MIEWPGKVVMKIEKRMIGKKLALSVKKSLSKLTKFLTIDETKNSIEAFLAACEVRKWVFSGKKGQKEIKK